MRTFILSCFSFTGNLFIFLASVEDYTECITNRKMKLTTSSGFISPSRPAGALTTACPWVIEALPGQKINVTLLDFGVYHQRKEGIRPLYCNRYASIREPDITQNTHRICGGTRREHNMYLSKGSKIEITLLQYADDNSPNRGRFMLKYEGKHFITSLDHCLIRFSVRI